MREPMPIGVVILCAFVLGFCTGSLRVLMREADELIFDSGKFHEQLARHAERSGGAFE